MRLEVEHRGYTLRYSDNADTWGCYELGVGYQSLAKAKAAIDKLLLKARKGAKAACLKIGYEGEFTEAEIIEYLGSRGRKSYEGAGSEIIEVGAMSVRLGGDRAGRSKEVLSTFAHDTPEVRAALEDSRLLRAQAARLQKQAREIVDAIPRLARDDIAELIRLRDEGIEEGEV